MSTKETTSNLEHSLRRLTSLFVRKANKQQRRKPPGGVGYSAKELSTDSFLELSSEVLPLDPCLPVDRTGTGTGHSQKDESTAENGNLWRYEVRQKCSELARNLKEILGATSGDRHGFLLKFPDDLPDRIAKTIVEAAKSEPCGLRGCCVNLRLLHEDVANALMVSENVDNLISNGRNEKCVSWPDVPVASTPLQTHSVCLNRPVLDFTVLPDMDATLTESFRQDKSTDSGFSENADVKWRRRPSLSSSSVPELPSLSAASRLHVACADLGRLDLGDSNSVPTFETFVYLAPTTSWTWRVRKMFFSSLNLGKRQSHSNGSFSESGRSLSVTSDFTLVKKKLYRTHSNSLEVIRCPPKR